MKKRVNNWIASEKKIPLQKLKMDKNLLITLLDIILLRS